MNTAKTLLAIALTTACANAMAAEQIGAVYASSNKAEGNTIVAFKQMSDGSLAALGEFKSGGKGTGNIEIFDGGYDPTHPLADGIDPLISAYGVYNTEDKKHLLTVNSGDGTISSFNVADDFKLKLVNTVKASDIHPVSIASKGKLVYVASSGDAKAPPFSGNISGFTIDAAGKLTPIANSTRNLGARPTTIVFSTDGKFVVVNELVTGQFKVFAVNADGSLSKEPVSVASAPNGDSSRALPIPVGFDIVKGAKSDIIVASEARFLDKKGMLREEAGKVPQSPKYSWQTSSSSSYTLDGKGQIKLVTADALTGDAVEGGEIANCWVETSRDGKTLWAANALSSSISAYTINPDGSIALKTATAYKNEAEMDFYSDLTLSADGKYINQLIGNKGEVTVFKVGADGFTLTPVGTYGGLPKIGAYGIISL